VDQVGLELRHPIPRVIPNSDELDERIEET